MEIPMMNGSYGGPGENGATRSSYPAKDKAKRNKIGVISVDNRLRDFTGDVLAKQGFEATALTLDSLVSGGNNFFVVDLFDQDYSLLREKIIHLRQDDPDAHIILLQSPSIPQSPRLRINAEKYLIPIVERAEHGNTTNEGLAKSANDVVAQIKEYLSKPSLIKVGGSIWDLYEKTPVVLEDLLNDARNLHAERYPIALTTGGGPRLDVEKGISETYGTQVDAKQILKRQALDIKRMLGDVAEIIPPSQIGKKPPKKKNWMTKEYFAAKIPIFFLSAEEDINPRYSDAHTLVIADMLAAYKIIFAKYTNGIYDKDPNKTTREERRLLGFIPIQASRDARFYPFIYSDQVLNGVIDRTGPDGKGEHLIETEALNRLMNLRTRNVRSVQIINGTKSGMLRYALDGQRYTGEKAPVGSFILRGEAPSNGLYK